MREEAKLALRAARSAPAVGLNAAATAAGVSQATARAAAVDTIRRGSAAERAATAYLNGVLGVRAAVISHRAIPPPVALRAARERSWRVSSAALGKAAWAPRDERARRGGRAGAALRASSQLPGQRYRAAKDTSLPASMLLRLICDDRSVGVTAEAVENPAADRTARGAAVACDIADTRRRAARRSDLPAGVLDRLGSDPDRYVRAAVAENPATASATLARLATDNDKQPRSAALRNAACPPDVLAATDKHAIAARNPSTPQPTLTRLSRDPDAEVRRNVASNPSTRQATLARLSRHNEIPVRRNVALNPSTPQPALTRLSRDPDAEVRRNVASNPSTSHRTLTRLSRDLETWVRRGVAGNVHCPQPALTRLSRDPEAWVRLSVADNTGVAAGDVAGDGRQQQRDTEGAHRCQPGVPAVAVGAPVGRRRQLGAGMGCAQPPHPAAICGRRSCSRRPPLYPQGRD